MDNDILNLEQAMEFLNVSEKTLLKLLREEHIPARKIGREWRFSRQALLRWIAEGDSTDYSGQNELYLLSKQMSGKSNDLFYKISYALSAVKEHGNNIRTLLSGLDRDIDVPEEASLQISYRQQKDVEKLEFELFWNLREDARLEANQKTASSD